MFFYYYSLFFLKLTTILQRFLNVPNRQDPNNGYTVVWALVLFYYTQLPTWPPQHGHVTAPSHQQQAAGNDEGSRRTSSSTSTSSLWEKAQTMQDTFFFFWALCKFFIFIFIVILIILMFYYNYHPQPSNTPPRCVPPPTPQWTATSPHHLRRIRAQDTMTCLKPLSFFRPPPPPRKHPQGPNDGFTVVQA